MCTPPLTVSYTFLCSKKAFPFHLFTICNRKTCKISRLSWVELSVFNVGLEQRYWAIADGLGFIPKDDLETCHRNFYPTRRGWLPALVSPEVYKISRKKYIHFFQCCVSRFLVKSSNSLQYNLGDGCFSSQWWLKFIIHVKKSEYVLVTVVSKHNIPTAIFIVKA